jgi:hypothetical protein
MELLKREHLDGNWEIPVEAPLGTAPLAKLPSLRPISTYTAHAPKSSLIPAETVNCIRKEGNDVSSRSNLGQSNN